jgi:hypothetical protein
VNTFPKKRKNQEAQRRRAGGSVTDLMCFNPRFRRSVQIELDINDPKSTAGYIATDFVVQSFERIGSAFDAGSTQRAWRLTGDYGSGKSGFALALAKAVSGKGGELPVGLRLPRAKRMQAVIVTGAREPLHLTIGRAIISQIPGMKKEPVPKDDSALIDLVNAALRKSPGIFLVLDELGKNLEQAMMNPASSDVYVLQRLAELATRSKDTPFVVLAILHMGISSYTADLDSNSRKEWDKVSGRFEEIHYHHPFEQTVQLCGAALGLDTASLPKELLDQQRKAMRWAVNAGYYGSAPSDSLTALAPAIFPLHPTVLPPLVTILRRFGQNERSLFGFLSGHEPSSLQDVARLKVSAARSFSLADLYNYFRDNIAHTMTNGRATHWRIIESVVRQGGDTAEVNILKAIGILNLIEDDAMLATNDLLEIALGNDDRAEQTVIERLVSKLKGRQLIFERGAVRGYALWPHTSVHLDDAFEEARNQLGEPPKPMRMVSALLEPRQIVARRHYIETGNLRHFELQFHPAADYEDFLQTGSMAHMGDADGYIAIFLPASDREHKEVFERMGNSRGISGPATLIGLTRPPLELLGIARDLHAWEHVHLTVKELGSDEYARRELKGQIRNARAKLNEQIDRLLGWNTDPGLVSWFRAGKPDRLEPDGLSSKLSQIATEIYSQCPIVTNELINRRITSSAGSRARTTLIEAISKNPSIEFLGMDDTKNPPEMAIYLSVLKAGNLHILDPEIEGRWKFVIPKGDSDACRLGPAFELIEKTLEANDGNRVAAPAILEALRSQPIGARDGLIPLILSLYLAACSRQTAVYEDSTYIHGLDGDSMQRFIKEPEHFELQRCAIEGVRLEVFDAIAGVFDLPTRSEPQVLDVVQPLMLFVSSIPEYCRNTKKLSAEAKAFRQALLTARDPAALIFEEIPAAAGIAPNEGKKLGVKIAALVGEIQGSYDALLARLAACITDAFDTTSDVTAFRNELIGRTGAIAKSLAETDLRSFVLRLGDEELDYRKWLESLANHLAKKSAVRWNDADEDVFDQRLHHLAKRMLRAEAAQADIARKGIVGDPERVVRLLLTRPDGNEHGELLHWNADEDPTVKKVASEISEIIRKHGRAGLGAAANALWAHLENHS